MSLTSRVSTTNECGFKRKSTKTSLHNLDSRTTLGLVQTSCVEQDRATRGILAEPWEKYVSSINGDGLGAYLDLGEGTTDGELVYVNFAPDTAVYTPAGVANGYQRPTDFYYFYCVNAHWSAGAYNRSHPMLSELHGSPDGTSRRQRDLVFSHSSTAPS